VLLDRHRTLSAAIALAALASCGDNDEGCPGVLTATTCRIARIEGASPGGELGFRFGAPLDMDGDGVEDLVVGARHGGPAQLGELHAWDLAGNELAAWNGESPDGLFGHSSLAVPDLDGDGRNDVVVSAPTAGLVGANQGVVDAYALDGRRLWRATGEPGDGFGWHLARAGDHDGDGIDDLWIGAPSDPEGAYVSLVSGRDGRTILTIPSSRQGDQFGWHVVAAGDLDGDGVSDVAIGAPGTQVEGVTRGSVTLASGATGAVLRELVGDRPEHPFGEMLAALDDLDGDGVPDFAIGGPNTDPTVAGAGEVSIVSGATGARLHLLTSGDRDELYGRMLATLDDIDGDGLRDLAIGAPWWSDRLGRVEVRSTRTYGVLAELDGTDPNGWLGWHITRADGRGFVVSLLHDDADHGSVEVHLVR
jgi:hypothetical protein